MVEEKRSPQPSIDDSFSYILDVKKALHDEPAEYYKFLKLMIDVSAHRIDEESAIRGITQLIKGHPKLLLGLSSFLPTAHEIIIPPEAKTIILPKDTSTMMSPGASRTRPRKLRIISSSQITIPPEAKTIILPKDNNTMMSPEASRTRPRKITITSSSMARVTIPPEAKTIILPKDTSTMMSPEASRTRPRKLRIISSSQITIPPEAKTIILPKDNSTMMSPEASRTRPPNDERPTGFDELIFRNSLETRFQRCDTHVVGSFCSIMKMYSERKKSAKEVHEEVVDLLYYHEDLIEDFSRSFLKHS